MIVETKEQLEEARKNNVAEIVIQGELAERVHKGKQITTIGAATLAVIGVAIAAIPFTGGASAVGAAIAGAGLGGFEIALILAIAFVGTGLLLAIWKEYDEVKFSHNPLELILRRKSKD